MLLLLLLLVISVVIHCCEAEAAGRGADGGRPGRAPRLHAGQRGPPKLKRTTTDIRYMFRCLRISNMIYVYMCLFTQV